MANFLFKIFMKSFWSARLRPMIEHYINERLTAFPEEQRAKIDKKFGNSAALILQEVALAPLREDIIKGLDAAVNREIDKVK